VSGFSFFSSIKLLIHELKIVSHPIIDLSPNSLFYSKLKIYVEREVSKSYTLPINF